jgi:hypothetical protein
MSWSITLAPPLSRPALFGVSRTLSPHALAIENFPVASELAGSRRRFDPRRNFRIRRLGIPASALNLGDRTETKELPATTS